MSNTITKNSDLKKRFRYDPDYYRKVNLSSRALEAKNSIAEKIKSGQYRYENYLCYCKSCNDLLLAEMDRYGNYYPFVICEKCGLMRANPRLTQDSYIDFYTHEYRSLYGDNDISKEGFYMSHIKQAEETYNFINYYIKLPSRALVFDIGCNMGTMLIPFHKNGYEVMGVDYSIEYVEFGRQKTGFSLEVGSIEKLRDSGKIADLVILNHVLEHLPDIDKELRQIREIMKPDAYIYVSVPGTFWWIKNICAQDMMGLLQNAHTWQFSLVSLRYVMECNGFEFVCGNEEIKSIFKNSHSIKRQYLDVPKYEYIEVMKYLNNLERIYLCRHFIVGILERFRFKNFIKRLLKGGK